MVGKAVIAFSQVIILARLLTPEEIGLVALCLTVLNTAQIISDLGLSSALIHYQDVTDEELDSLFWLNVVCGLVLSVSLLALSPIIASFYRKPDLTVLIALSSAYFLIWSLGAQQRVLAEKSLNFKVLSYVEVGAFAAAFVVTITSAVAGLGPASVVLGFIFNSVVNTVSAWLILSNGRLPRLRFSISEIQRFWKFGLEALGVSLTNTLALQSDVIVAGRGFSASTVGAYFQPRELVLRLMFVINPIITRVALPLMASARNDKTRIKRIYLQALRMTASTNFPLYLFISAFSYDIVFILFGSKWVTSAPLLRLLGLWCAFRSVGNPVGSLLLAVGETRRGLFSASIVMVSLFAVESLAVRFGVQVLVKVLIGFYIVCIPSFWAFLVAPSCGAGFLEYHKQIVVPAIIAAVSVGFSSIALYVLQPHYLDVQDWWTSLARIATGGAICATIYLTISYFFNKQWVEAILEFVGRRVPGSN